MKYIIAFITLIFAVACTENDTTNSIEASPPVSESSMYDSPSIVREIALYNPYEISYNVEKTTDRNYNLITTIKLFGGSFFVSPHSTREFTGKFRIEIVPNNYLVLENDFIETPRSKEVHDPHPFVDGLVNWVNEDTKYEHHLTLNTQDNFDVRGKIIFTIEPKCTMEEIPVIFKYRSGVLSIEKWMC